MIIKYLYYWLDFCKQDFLVKAEGGGQPNISQNKIKNQIIYIPSIGEQQLIVSFLDSKCAEIDALTADIQSEIETLEAYKRSVVFDVVEHGIGHTEFIETDSDVWKSIPKGWKLVDIKYIFEIVKRIAGKEGYDIIAITQQGLNIKIFLRMRGNLHLIIVDISLCIPAIML